ncbi:MAG: Patatin-like phospholipase [Gemmataceae bacterium]|nr:Patatin-like phospholipase [Gemmataceae bacterium]
MRARLAMWLVVCAFLVASPACARRNCVPAQIAANRNLIDLSAPPDAHAPVAKGVTREVEAEFRRRSAGQHPPGARPYNFLALSGGGLYGSFGIGVLNGWTETGTRPQFDVVTGISTGALMSTFAYLGPEYDGALRENMLGVERADILRARSVLRIPFADAVFTSRPLARRIEEVCTPQLLCEVAKAHAGGRRLYVGTTNIDTRRLVIWDMGAIAARGTPEAADLYRKVILASSSIPGAFPPVRIPVEIDGKWYDELHVDGGASDEVIFRAFMVADLNRMAGVPGAQAPAGSSLYVISNGKLYADPQCLRPKLGNMVSAAFRSIVYGKARDELYRIYLNCLETGVEFRVTAVPQEFQVRTSGSLTLSREDQHRLFEVGRQLGRSGGVGEGWRDVPPGTDPAEQILPRTGTKFATPGGISEVVMPGPAPQP